MSPTPCERQAWVRVLCMEAFHIQEDHAVEALNAAAKSFGNIKDKLDDSMEQNKGGKYMTEPIAEATVASTNAKKKIKQLEKAMLYNVKYTLIILSARFSFFCPPIPCVRLSLAT